METARESKSACTWPFPADWTTSFLTPIWNSTEGPQRLSLFHCLQQGSRGHEVFFTVQGDWQLSTSSSITHPRFLFMQFHFEESLALHSCTDCVICTSVILLDCEKRRILSRSLFQRDGHMILVVHILPHAYHSLFCRVGIWLLAHRESFPDGGIQQSHAFPLPSAFCCEHRGWSNLIALRGELEEKGLWCSFGRSRTWVQKQVPCSKASELAFGHPRCKASTPSVFACQKVGVGWRIWSRVQRVSAVSSCPTGNDRVFIELNPAQPGCERRSGGLAHSWQDI